MMVMMMVLLLLQKWHECEVSLRPPHLYITEHEDIRIEVSPYSKATDAVVVIVFSAYMHAFSA
jgi:hypothetical protein